MCESHKLVLSLIVSQENQIKRVFSFNEFLDCANLFMHLSSYFISLRHLFMSIDLEIIRVCGAY
jgi:hypothetical protein